jgi:WD40 repeat protein
VVSNADYDAFLSYSHAVDSSVAASLQRQIRRVGHPWYRRSTLRIFRDKTNESTSQGLWRWIESALKRSESFILLASPSAATSPWVNREILFWREIRDQSTFSIVLTDGDIVWSDADGDFDWSRSTALPSALSGWFTEEPQWLDVRQREGSKVRDQRSDRLRDAARAIAAPLRGVEKDQLDGEDERETRRALRTLRAGVAALTVVALLFASAAVFAYNQYRAADEGQRLATARLLITRAEAILGADPRTALQLGVAANEVYSAPETRASLAHLLLNTKYLGAIEGPHGAVESVAFNPAGDVLAIAGHNIYPDESVLLWDFSDQLRPRRLGDPLSGSSAPAALTFSPDGRTLAVAGGLDEVTLWDLADPAHPRRLNQFVAQGVESVYDIKYSPVANILAAAGENGVPTLWDLADPLNPRRLDSSSLEYGGAVHVLAFSSDGTMLAAGGDANSVAVWDVAEPSRPQPLGDPLRAHTGPVDGLEFSPADNTLASTSRDQTVVLWDRGNPTQPRRIGDPLVGHSDWVTAVLSLQTVRHLPRQGMTRQFYSGIWAIRRDHDASVIR